MNDLEQTLVQKYAIAGHRSTAIATSIENGILRGALRAGGRLPTVRALAGDLGVSTATVAAAYRMLRERGLVAGSGRSGTVVRSPGPRSARRTAPVTPPGARNLANGNPDPALLPDLAAAFGRLPVRHRLYGEVANRPELLDHARGQFAGDGIDARHIAVVGGALDGIERALLTHTRPGDRVAVEDPGYCGLLDLLAAMNLDPVAAPIDEAGMRPDGLDAALRSGCPAVVVTPRVQNPTGVALTGARARELRAVIRRYEHVLVVEDDHAALIADAPLRTVAGASSRWVTVRSMAKALGPDVRLALLAGDPVTVARLEGRQQSGAGWVTHLLQDLVVAVLADPHAAELLGLAARTYSRRRAALASALAARGIHSIGISGLNLWVPLDQEATAAQALLARGWAVRAGEVFRLRSRPGVRITTATLRPDEAVRLADDILAIRSATSRTGAP